jgi:hypothetical protein
MFGTVPMIVWYRTRMVNLGEQNIVNALLQR